MKYILLCLIFSFCHAQYGQYNTWSFFRNRDYEMKKIQMPYNEIPTLTTDAYLNETTSDRNLNESLNRKNRVLDRRDSDEFEDIYRVSLSSDNPSYKVIVVQKDLKSNESVLLINTFITYKDNLGYPYSQRKSADEVYMYPNIFAEFVSFLFTDDKVLNLTAGDDNYIINKHSAQDSFFHLTILMKIFLGKNGENSIYQYRGVWLNLREYQFLLSRASQLLRDLNV